MCIAMYFTELIKILEQKRDSFLNVSVMLLFNIISKQVHWPKIVIHLILIGILQDFFQGFLNCISSNLLLPTGFLYGTIALAAEVNPEFLENCGGTIIFCYHLPYCQLICHLHCSLTLSFIY